MRREVYSKMLMKRQQKSSTRLCDGVVVREWMEYKIHHHVYESRTFSKRPTWCKLTITLIRRALAESSHELILGHCLQTLTTRIVRKLYPRNPKHICNKLRCDRNACTSNTSKEKRYWTINPMHVGVKLLNKNERTSDSHSQLWMTVGRSVLAKSARMTWRFEWTPRVEKFSENALWASSSWNRRERGAESEDEEAPERRGFWAGVYLRLGTIDTTNVNRKRGRERKTIKKVPSNSNIKSILKREYICMGNVWTWDM